MTPARPVGTLCLVLHTHLPWVAHHGTWPVGEEWLHQAFTHSWRPVLRVLERLAAEGRRDLLTLGITPVVAAMLDDPYCLRELHTWAGIWQLRAEGLAGRGERHLRELASYEFAAASDCLADLESRWLRGGSAVIRPLVDSGVIELLGGPTTHPFLPTVDSRMAAHLLRTGLDDTRIRLGSAPEGIWAPECGYRPGLESVYAAAGVRRFVVDEATLGGRTAQAHPLGDSGVFVFGRDLAVTDRVWSARTGYPAAPEYRDFHTFDHPSGFRPARVTGTHVDPDNKLPWDPALAEKAIERDAWDFVDAVRRRLTELAAREGRPGLAVAAWDTELFGHWWHEGPQWLDRVLRLLPEAGIRATSLRGAIEAGHLGARVELDQGSWGAGKDFRLWAGDQVADVVQAQDSVVARLASIVDARPSPARDATLDQLDREAHLALSSDWAFMVSRDSAADYAQRRAAGHVSAFHRLADLVESGHGAEGYAAELRAADGPFGHLDARQL